ncbi:DUF411 domain-containing protein [Roseateles sp.]|uniref:DUF411 domain-containing protein n=1 Tax=Roseateles sp. TaxID=1971397 RepID=UPI00395EB619
MKRRFALTALAAGAVSLALPALAAASLPPVDVYKSPTCGCCGAWVDHLKAAGFSVRVVEVDDIAQARKRFGLPDKFGSCHTGVVDGYVVEGHVPAAEIKRLLSSRPAAIGLAVPGMPIGSPGMEYPGRSDPYDVLLIDRKGRESVFAHYPKA